MALPDNFPIIIGTLGNSIFYCQVICTGRELLFYRVGNCLTGVRQQKLQYHLSALRPLGRGDDAVPLSEICTIRCGEDEYQHPLVGIYFSSGRKSIFVRGDGQIPHLTNPAVFRAYWTQLLRRSRDIAAMMPESERPRPQTARPRDPAPSDARRAFYKKWLPVLYIYGILLMLLFLVPTFRPWVHGIITHLLIAYVPMTMVVYCRGQDVLSFSEDHWQMNHAETNYKNKFLPPPRVLLLLAGLELTIYALYTYHFTDYFRLIRAALGLGLGLTALVMFLTSEWKRHRDVLPTLLLILLLYAPGAVALTDTGLGLEAPETVSAEVLETKQLSRNGSTYYLARLEVPEGDRFWDRVGFLQYQALSPGDTITYRRWDGVLGIPYVESLWR